MAKKEFTYRGKTIEELKMMSVNEFAEIVPSRIRRSIKRGFTDAQKRLLEKIKKKHKNLKTHCRDMVILPEMVDMTIKIHNGKEFVSIMILPDMIGHCLGEFALTRNKVSHSAPGVGATKSSSSISVR